MRADDSHVVVAEDLTIGYPGLDLFTGEAFAIERGQVFAVMGDSGSGKSTLLRCMIGLQSPKAGTLTVAGRTNPEVAPGRPEHGVSFQSGALFGDLTVGENLDLPLQAWTGLDRATRGDLIRAKLALVGVEQLVDRSPADISGGQAKRVAIARSLMLDPSLIFLDEPFAGLDPVTARDLEGLILRLNRALGVTVVMVSHMVPRVLRVADRCLIISADERAIVAQGVPRDLRHGPPNEIAAAFLGSEAA